MFAAGDDYVCHLVEQHPCVSPGEGRMEAGAGQEAHLGDGGHAT